MLPAQNSLYGCVQGFLLTWALAPHLEVPSHIPLTAHTTFTRPSHILCTCFTHPLCIAHRSSHALSHTVHTLNTRLTCSSHAPHTPRVPHTSFTPPLHALTRPSRPSRSAHAPHAPHSSSLTCPSHTLHTFTRHSHVPHASSRALHASTLRVPLRSVSCSLPGVGAGI